MTKDCICLMGIHTHTHGNTISCTLKETTVALGSAAIFPQKIPEKETGCVLINTKGRTHNGACTMVGAMSRDIGSKCILKTTKRLLKVRKTLENREAFYRDWKE